MKILFVGNLRQGSNSLSLANGFEKYASGFSAVDTSSVALPKIGSPEWVSLKLKHKPLASTSNRIAEQLRELVRAHKPDALVAVKTLNIDQRMLLDLPVPIKAHLSFDDVSNPDNLSDAYLASESEWDCIITTKRHNVAELKDRGARNVLQIWSSYDQERSRVTKGYSYRRYECGFIGVSRPDRIDLPVQMSINSPNSGIIVGPHWRRTYPFGVRGLTLRGGIFGEQQTFVANDIKVGLLLLNSDNRDTHTSRTFEIPASGQVVLGQRTLEHEELFIDNKEAMLFSSQEEMWEKFRFLTANPAAAERLALSGYNAISKGSNTYDDRAKQIIKHLSSLSGSIKK